MLGESYVGKTLIINLYIRKENIDVLRTIGMEESRLKKTFDNLEYKFKIFDTAGQERYRSIAYTTIQISDGYFLVFAVDNKNSFLKINKFIDYIDDHVNLEEKVLYLIGNKIDVKPEDREVTKEEVEKFAKSKNVKYFETSARAKKGINEAFEEMFKDIYEKYKLDNEKEINDHFELDKKNNKKKTNFLYEIFKKNNKEKIINHCETDKKDNKDKSNYRPFSNYILDKYNNY